MESKLFFKKVFLLVVIVAALFTLTACKKEAQKEDEATEAILQPSSTPVPPETSVKEPTQEANDVSTTEYISTTNLIFRGPFEQTGEILWVIGIEPWIQLLPGSLLVTG